MRDPGARAFHERVACSAIQVQSGRNGTNGLHVGPAPLAAFERADGVDRKARDGREFLLREARCLPKGLQTRAKRPW